MSELGHEWSCYWSGLDCERGCECYDSYGNLCSHYISRNAWLAESEPEPEPDQGEEYGLTEEDTWPAELSASGSLIGRKARYCYYDPETYEVFLVTGQIIDALQAEKLIALGFHDCELLNRFVCPCI